MHKFFGPFWLIHINYSCAQKCRFTVLESTPTFACSLKNSSSPWLLWDLAHRQWYCCCCCCALDSWYVVWWATELRVELARDLRRQSLNYRVTIIMHTRILHDENVENVLLHTHVLSSLAYIHRYSVFLIWVIMWGSLQLAPIIVLHWNSS